MANANSTAFVNKPTELQIDEYPWAIHYRGTETALTAAGLIKPEWFPGKPGNPKTSVRIGIIDGEMRMLPRYAPQTKEQMEHGVIAINTAGKLDFRVWIYRKKEERERLEKEEEWQFAKERIEKAHKEKAKRISEIPATHGEYLRRELHTIQSMMSVIRSSLTNSYGYTGGYGFSPDLVVEFDILADHLIQMVKEERIYFNQEKRQREIAKIESEVMGKHPEFSAFMAATLAIGKAAA